MRGFYSKGLVFVLVLVVLMLSGCVTTVNSVTFTFQDGVGVQPGQVHLRFSDGTTADGGTGGALQTPVMVQNSAQKQIVGGYLTDGTVSWVPEFSYGSGSSVTVLISTESQKPSLPAMSAQLLSVKPDQNHSGYVDATFKINDASNQPVTGRTEVFAHSSPTVDFYNADDMDTNIPYYTRTDSVKEGFSSYTTNGKVTFIFKPNGDFSLPPLSLHSGPIQIYNKDTLDPVAVTFNSNGGTLVSSQTVYYKGMASQPTAPTKDGYTFAGWYSDSDLMESFDFSSPLVADTELFAKWESDASYTVTYNENGATAGNVPTDSNTYAEGATVTVAGNTGNLVKTGYTFAGWNTEADGNGTSYASANSFTMGGENVTLYAQWASANTLLSGLSVNAGTLTPTFSAATFSYGLAVANNVPSLTVTATADDSDATLTVGGNLASSGQPSAAIPLRVGSNLIAIVVTAEDQSTQTYTILVTRAQPPLPAFYPVTGVSLDQSELSLMEGGENAILHATITPSYATNQSVIWSSSNPQVATISGNGVVTPLAPGTATITITTADQGKTATCEVTVRAEKKLIGLEASEKTILLKPNESTSVELYAIYSNGTKEDITNDQDVSYRSSSRTIATISDGVIKAGKKEGKTTITITYQSKRLMIPLQVSKVDVTKVKLQPTSVELGKGEAKQLQLTATLSNKETENVTKLAAWSSSDPDVATVDENGKLKAIAPGTAVITATYGGKTAEIAITVDDAKQARRILASKKRVTIAVGKKQALKLTAYYHDSSTKIVTDLADWSSADETIATVENGMIYGNVKGTVKIEATYQGQSYTITVIVTE